jgi:hypothetical protein
MSLASATWKIHASLFLLVQHGGSSTKSVVKVVLRRSQTSRVPVGQPILETCRSHTAAHNTLANTEIGAYIYRIAAIPSLQKRRFNPVVCGSSSGRISMSPSLSESLLSESQKFMMHQTIRMVTNPEADPKEARICVVASRKLNSNRATKNAQTLYKLVMSLSGNCGTRGTTTHDHISSAYVRLNITAKGSR